MNTYIAILRGINVGGRNKVKMDDLKDIFNSSGHKKVQTYIQSGNIIFKNSSKSTSDLSDEIESQLKQKFEFEIPCLVLSKTEIEHAVQNNPFLNEQDDITKLHCTFLKTEASKEIISSLDTNIYSPDVFKIIGKVVYINCPNGYGKTKLNNTFFERKLKVQATTRNWKTTLKLQELSM